jgi:hypothetical protein
MKIVRKRKIKELITKVIYADIRRMLTCLYIDEIDNLTFNSSLIFEKSRGIQITEITKVEPPEDSTSVNMKQKLDSLF